jgi:hypothetical protein
MKALVAGRAIALVIGQHIVIGLPALRIGGARQRFSHKPGESAIRPTTMPDDRTIATGNVSVLADPRTVS